MFVTPNVKVFFKTAGLKRETVADETRRVADAQYVIDPFPPELAHQLGEDICAHLFDEADAVRPEVTEVKFNRSAGLQRLTARLDPAMRPDVVVDEVSVVGMKASKHTDAKTGREWMAFTITLRVPLDTKAAREFIISRFDHEVYLTFEAMQRALPMGRA